MTYEDLRKANETVRTMDIKGKEYAQVNERIRVFRMLFPEGFIKTEMLSNSNGVCVFRAQVGYFCLERPVILATGTAYEVESANYINKTSYIENCETSAVGRALGMLGIGIDTSVASAEEVDVAIMKQEKSMAEELLELAKKAGVSEENLKNQTMCDELNKIDAKTYARAKAGLLAKINLMGQANGDKGKTD